MRSMVKKRKGSRKHVRKRNTGGDLRNGGGDSVCSYGKQMKRGGEEW